MFFVGAVVEYPTRNTSGLNWKGKGNAGTPSEYPTETLSRNVFGDCVLTSSFPVSPNVSYQNDASWIAFVATTSSSSIEREFTQFLNQYKDRFGNPLHLFTLNNFEGIPNRPPFANPVGNYVASDGSNWQYFNNLGLPE